MVAALAALAIGRAAELAAPDHQRVLEHPALLQVLEQRGDRLIDVAAHLLVVGVHVVVGVPLHDERPAA